MTSDLDRWQNDASRCFEWLTKLYEQAQTLWADADAMFQEVGWQTQCGAGFGGIAMSMGDLAKWPFAYFKVMGAYPNQPDGADELRGVFFGIVFHDKARIGPHCVAGVAAWTHDGANCDHWALYSAVNGTRCFPSEAMYESSDGPIHTARITDKGRKQRPGMEDVLWFEIPLATIDSPDRLRGIVQAAIALYGGNDRPAREVTSWKMVSRDGDALGGPL